MYRREITKREIALIELSRARAATTPATPNLLGLPPAVAYTLHTVRCANHRAARGCLTCRYLEQALRDDLRAPERSAHDPTLTQNITFAAECRRRRRRIKTRWKHEDRR
jgi:hypothetical protein